MELVLQISEVSVALSERNFVDKIEVLPMTGHVYVRRAIVVLRDGEEIARNCHRHVLTRGDDLSREEPYVAAIARTAWAPEIGSTPDSGP